MKYKYKIRLGKSLRLWCSAEVAVGVEVAEMITGTLPIPSL